MKPTLILNNKEVFHNLGLLKIFNSVEFNYNKKNINTLNKVLKNINRNKNLITLTKKGNKIILHKKYSKLDFHLYLR